jgi:hypothetical protein
MVRENINKEYNYQLFPQVRYNLFLYIIYCLAYRPNGIKKIPRLQGDPPRKPGRKKKVIVGNGNRITILKK